MTGSICYNSWCNTLYSSNKYLGICYKYWGNVSVAAIYKYPMIRCCFCVILMYLNRGYLSCLQFLYCIHLKSKNLYCCQRGQLWLQWSYPRSEVEIMLDIPICHSVTAGQLLILMYWDWGNFLLLCYMQTVQRLFKLEQINLYPWDFK